MSNDLTPLLLRAISFSAAKHKGQRRADGSTPYFAHVVRVSIILRQLFQVDDEDLLIAAFLHDTLEDTDTDYDELADLFGTLVADYVVALTKNSLLSKSKRELDYEVRLLEAPEPVRIAKLADIYDNLTDRVGTPKITKTLETAVRLTTSFTGTFSSQSGLDALRLVRELINKISVA